MTGENVSDYIDRMRIKKAKTMMKNGKFKINEISHAVGYENPTSFTRFFKRMAFCSPQEYYDKIINNKNCQQSKKSKQIIVKVFTRGKILN